VSAGARRGGAAAPAGTTWAGAGRIDGGADIARVLAAVNAAGQSRERTAEMPQAVERADDVALDRPDASRVLPVGREVAELLPWPGGIRRGTTVAAIGSTSLLMALLSEASAAGSWAAVVGMPAFGVLAAAECGVELSRLALVPEPGPQWPTVVGALLDGLDVVIVNTPTEVPAGTARSLMARARQRGAVIITTRPWPGCDVTIKLVERQWHGLGHGRGRLRGQEVTLSATGRGKAAQPRQVTTTLPPTSALERLGVPDAGAARWSEQRVPIAAQSLSELLQPRSVKFGSEKVSANYIPADGRINRERTRSTARLAVALRC
jgi:hypothetical protein